METKKIIMPLVDKHNRHLNYLRISITDRCNLQCLYCMPFGGIIKLRHEEILTYEEILRLVRFSVNLGVEKVRLTGGEPLLRKGIYGFIKRLTAIPGLKDISLTTNGVYLKKNLERLRSAGIKRLNISLDTLHREKYKKITGFDGFQQVWEAIESAKKMGFQPIKINMVVIKGVNDDELPDFARFSQKNPYQIRFIEYMPLGIRDSDNFLFHVPNSLIKTQLSRLGRLIPVSQGIYDGPAERFKFEGALGEIGFISPMSHNFCHKCNRLRLTASGNLRPCLLSDKKEDLKGPLRAGATDSELAQIFLNAALSKPHAHGLSLENPIVIYDQMSSIGG